MFGMGMCFTLDRIRSGDEKSTNAETFIVHSIGLPERNGESSRFSLQNYPEGLKALL